MEEKFKRVGSHDLSQERGIGGEGTSSGGSLPPLSQATATLGEATASWGGNFCGGHMTC